MLHDGEGAADEGGSTVFGTEEDLSVADYFGFVGVFHISEDVFVSFWKLGYSLLDDVRMIDVAHDFIQLYMFSFELEEHRCIVFEDGDQEEDLNNTQNYRNQRNQQRHEEFIYRRTLNRWIRIHQINSIRNQYSKCYA